MVTQEDSLINFFYFHTLKIAFLEIFRVLEIKQFTFNAVPRDAP